MTDSHTDVPGNVTPRGAPASALDTGLLCPFDLTVDQIAGFLNAEIADHPVYDGFELQWFDDPSHGTGMLAFLSRRADRRVDYYVDPALRLDRAGYEIGGGTGRWVETDFDAATLHVGDEGVVADVRFIDVDGRRIEVVVDDRGAGLRRPSNLLAPVGSAIERPNSLLLAYLHGFDLLRRGAEPPRISIDGQRVSAGTLPGSVLHRRHLIKAAAPLSSASVCRARFGPVLPVAPGSSGDVLLDEAGGGIVGLATRNGGAEATMMLDPPLPPLGQLADGELLAGTWYVTIDGDTITGGTWSALRHTETVDLVLDVTRRWDPPPGLPPLMRLVTRLMPMFRRWPTTYRWTAEVDLGDTPPTIASRWGRTGSGGSDAYRRTTGS